MDFPRPSSFGGAMKMFLCGIPLKYAFVISTNPMANGFPFLTLSALYLEKSFFLASSGGVLP